MDEEEQQFCGLEGISAPIVRQVEAKTGAVFRPLSMAAALQLLDEMRRDNEKLVEKVQEALAERDNLIAAIPDTAPLREFLKDALAARDDAEAQCAALDEELQAARCRIEELES